MILDDKPLREFLPREDLDYLKENEVKKLRVRGYNKEIEVEFKDD